MNITYSRLLEDAEEEIKELKKDNKALELRLDRKKREMDRLYKKLALFESCLELSEKENSILRKSKNTGAYNFMNNIDSERTGSLFAEENVKQISDRICETEKGNTEPDNLRQRSMEMCHDFVTIDSRMAGLSNDYSGQKEVIKTLIDDTKELYESYGKLRKTKFREFMEERKRIKDERKALLARKKELEKQYAQIGKVVTDLAAIRDTVKKSEQRFSSCVGWDDEADKKDKKDEKEEPFIFEEKIVIPETDDSDDIILKDESSENSLQAEEPFKADTDESEMAEDHDNDTAFTVFDDFSSISNDNSDVPEEIAEEKDDSDGSDENEEEKESASAPVRRNRRTRR